MRNPALRTALAIVVGVMVAAIVVFAMEGLGHDLFPPPADLDLSNPQDQARLMATMPLAAKLMVVLAWFLGALGGSAAAIAVVRKPLAGWIVATVMVALSLWTTQMLPHPAWMVACAVLLPPAAAWLAGRLLAQRLTAQALA